jgi:hypothetical protein
VGGGIEADPLTESIAQISGLPPVDNDKWHIYVVGRKGCAPCLELARLWKTDATLRAWAMPDNPRDSWAHFQYFNYDDPLESWRWTKSPENPNPVVIKSVPTIVAQPPRNGRYGDPANVVMTYVWEGDPKLLSSALQRSIRAYLTFLERSPRRGIEGAGAGAGAGEKEQASAASVPVALVAYPVAGAPAGSLAGFGQQQFPPLDLPLEPKEPRETPAETARERPLVRALRGPEILVVRDHEEEVTPEVQRQLDAHVKALQASGGPYRVRHVDVAKAAAYGITADDCPCVVQVEGKRCVQKMVARLDGPEHKVEGLGMLAGLAFFFFSSVFSGGTAVALAKTMELMVYGFVILVAIIVVVFVLKPRGPSAADLAAAMLLAQQQQK